MNRAAAANAFEDESGLADDQQALLFDPQTSGGLLLCVPLDLADSLVGALRDAGEAASIIGEVAEGPPRVTVV